MGTGPLCQGQRGRCTNHPPSGAGCQKELRYLYSPFGSSRPVFNSKSERRQRFETAHKLYHYKSDKRIVNCIVEDSVKQHLLRLFSLEEDFLTSYVRYKVNFQTTSCNTKLVRTQYFMGFVLFSYFDEHLPSKRYTF